MARSLRWSVRTSFLSYVAGLPDGRASVSDGAELTTTDPQQVIFSADPGHTADDVLAFRGDLRLAGHGGLLFVRLAHPRITLDGNCSALTVDDPLTEDGSGPRLPLVTLTMTEEVDSWSGSDVRLTAEGVSLFNHVYPAGEVFDGLVVS